MAGYESDRDEDIEAESDATYLVNEDLRDPKIVAQERALLYADDADDLLQPKSSGKKSLGAVVGGAIVGCRRLIHSGRVPPLLCLPEGVAVPKGVLEVIRSDTQSAQRVADWLVLNNYLGTAGVNQAATVTEKRNGGVEATKQLHAGRAKADVQISLSAVRELMWGEARIQPEDLDALEDEFGPDAFDSMAKQGACPHDRAGSHFLRDPKVKAWHDRRLAAAFEKLQLLATTNEHVKTRLQQMETACPEQVPINVAGLSSSGRKWMMKQWAGAIASGTVGSTVLVVNPRLIPKVPVGTVTLNISTLREVAGDLAALILLNRHIDEQNLLYGLTLLDIDAFGMDGGAFEADVKTEEEAVHLLQNMKELEVYRHEYAHPQLRSHPGHTQLCSHLTLAHLSHSCLTRSNLLPPPPPQYAGSRLLWTC